MKYFNIQMASQFSGLSTHTIRAWEKRYQAVTPKRTDTGRRQYSQADIDRLSLLSKLTQIGNSIGQIANLSIEELKNILTTLTSQENPTKKTDGEARPNIDIEQSLVKLYTSIKDYQLQDISQILQLAGKALDSRRNVLDILAPFCKEVIKQYKDSQISLGQFSALKAIIKFQTGKQLFVEIDKKRQSQTKIALTTPEGEYTPFDILMSALLCCHYNLNFYYFSTALPANSILEAINAIDAQVLVLGVSDERQLKENLDSYIETIIYQMDDKFKLWLVGPSSNINSNIYKMKNVRVFDNFEQVDRALSQLQ